MNQQPDEGLLTWYHEEIQKLEYQLNEARHITHDQYREAVAVLDEELERKLQEIPEPARAELPANVIPFKRRTSPLPWFDLPPEEHEDPGPVAEMDNMFTFETRVIRVIPRDGTPIVLLATPFAVEAGSGLSFLTRLPFHQGSKVRVVIALEDDRRDSAA